MSDEAGAAEPVCCAPCTTAGACVRAGAENVGGGAMTGAAAAAVVSTPTGG
jgi:hypothetical protein